MITKIFTKSQVKAAAELLKKGELVAFPTETVYGLGANALDTQAVKKIFNAKGRPADNPLIIHIATKKQLEAVAKVSEVEKKLIYKFWPGPLTVILKKNQLIPKTVTAGLNTVAVRMPKHKIALDLIKFSKLPIAAPSANISGKPSGTSFEHVLDDFNGKVAGIIKAQDSAIGIESTVIDLTTAKPILLRPGGTSFEKLKKVFVNLTLAKNTVKKPKSPGMKYKHYSPEAKLILFEVSGLPKMEQWQKKLTKLKKKFVLLHPKKIKNFSQKMFKMFRGYDKQNIDYILISSLSERGIGLAVMNRLRKAASQIIK